MARIAFLLLCHKDPDAIVAQARQLTAAGDCLAIHFDARASDADYDKIRAALRDDRSVTFTESRVRCGWGEWSLVEATLHAIRAALAAFPQATHLYLVSGDCMAIKSAAYAHRLLDAADLDYIESVDFFESGWIRTGIRDERLTYRHWFNERSQKRLFYLSLALQRRLRLERAVPADLSVQIGSQWWCLRRRTVERILGFLEQRRDVLRFFRTTWIPDESFFQTLVRHLVPAAEIESRTLTFLMFSDYGMPVTFHNDHYDLLLGQDFLFARKISPEATELKARLGQLYASGRLDFPISSEGRRLFAFLTGRGRIGRRFGPRFWDGRGSLGRDHELLIVASPKRHVAQRLADAIRRHTDVPALDHVFDEAEAPLPDLGGIETSLLKRHRHRRVLMRLLFDQLETERLVVCLDTGALDLLRDFFADRLTVRLLEIDCLLTDAFLATHARRIGLAGDATSESALRQLLPALRQAIADDSDRLREARFPNHLRLVDGASPAANASPIERFLSVPPDIALAIAGTPDLFAD